jgi:hypothetical protein
LQVKDGVASISETKENVLLIIFFEVQCLFLKQSDNNRPVTASSRDTPEAMEPVIIIFKVN